MDAVKPVESEGEVAGLSGICSSALLMEDFDTICAIHSSSEGLSSNTVELCTQRSTGDHVVVKIFNKSLLRKQMRRSLSKRNVDPISKMQREIAIMQRLDHPNVVKHHQIIENESDGMVYIVMEYVPGGPSMRWNIAANKYDATFERECVGLKELTARAYFRDALEGLEYIHRQNIVHRDIKPENLLVTEESTGGSNGVPGMLKIADFGVSCFVSAEDDTIYDTQGTLVFEAPESFSGESYSGYKSDIWALGVTLYAFCFQSLPFHGDGPDALNSSITNGDFNVPEETNPALINLLRCLLRTNPVQRITIQEMKDHPWIREVKD